MKIKVNCEITVSFEPYDSKVKNKKAIAQIKRHIKNALEEDCSYIPLEIEPYPYDSKRKTWAVYDGKFFDDYTRKSKIKVTLGPIH